MTVLTRAALVHLAILSGSLAAAAPPARIQGDEADAIAAVERALNDSKNGPAGVKLAVGELEGHDSPAVAAVLAEAFQRLEADAQSFDRRAFPQLERGQLSQGEIVDRRRLLDPIRSAQAEILTRVGALRRLDSAQWLLDELIGDEKQPMSLKLEAIRAAVFHGAGIVPALDRALQRAKNSDDVQAVLLAAQRLETSAAPLAERIVPHVDHADATIREAAALALAKLASPLGVEPLVKRLEKETGRTQLRFAAALEILTRQKLGLGVNAWKSWFAAEGIRYTSGQAELGGGEAAVTMVATGYFHGIPQDGRSIVYVIDVSGSMVVSLTDPKFEDADHMRPIPAPYGEPSRMDCSRDELIKALGELPLGTLFNIVFFSTAAERYSPKMLEASLPVIKKAQKWVEQLRPDGATNIHDAMESAFGLAGRGPIDRFYDSNVDTIFLLTDGQPMLPGMRDSPERVIALARRVNPFQRVVVHTIGLGAGIDAAFLRRLAEENGGVFVQR